MATRCCTGQRLLCWSGRIAAHRQVPDLFRHLRSTVPQRIAGTNHIIML